MDVSVDSVAGEKELKCIPSVFLNPEGRQRALECFIQAFHEEVTTGPDGRDVVPLTDVLRSLIEVIEIMEGEMDDVDTVHFLGEIMEWVGASLKEGIMVAYTNNNHPKSGEQN